MMAQYEMTVETEKSYYSYDYDNDLESIIDAYAFMRGDLVLDEKKDEHIFEIKITEVVAPGGMIGDTKTIFHYRLYTTYAEDTDITFIMSDTIKFGKAETEVLGFAYGGLLEDEIHRHIGKLVAKYNV